MNASASESAGPRRFARLVFAASSPGWVCSVPNGLDLETGAFYLVSTADGRRVGRMSAFELPVLRNWNPPVPSILRLASDEEVARAAVLALRQCETLDVCRRLVRDMNLPLRPVGAIAPLDREVVIVTYAAEERVDFRDLLRELTPRTHCRVELRQIGVRDQAKAAGGWGPCGRLLCCTTFMTRFNSVTIRMAKAQRLSLNPARISGMCGRLMCCLAHEAPPKGEMPARSEVETPRVSPRPADGAAGDQAPAKDAAPREGESSRRDGGPAGSGGRHRRDRAGGGSGSGRNERVGTGARTDQGDGAGGRVDSIQKGTGEADSGRVRADGLRGERGAGGSDSRDPGPTGGAGTGRSGSGDVSTGRGRGGRFGRRNRPGPDPRSGQGAGPRQDDGTAGSGGAGGVPDTAADPRPAPDRDPSVENT